MAEESCPTAFHEAIKKRNALGATQTLPGQRGRENVSFLYETSTTLTNTKPQTLREKEAANPTPRGHGRVRHCVNRTEEETPQEPRYTQTKHLTKGSRQARNRARPRWGTGQTTRAASGGDTAPFFPGRAAAETCAAIAPARRLLDVPARAERRGQGVEGTRTGTRVKTLSSADEAVWKENGDGVSPPSVGARPGLRPRAAPEQPARSCQWRGEEELWRVLGGKHTACYSYWKGPNKQRGPGRRRDRCPFQGA